MRNHLTHCHTNLSLLSFRLVWHLDCNSCSHPQEFCNHAYAIRFNSHPPHDVGVTDCCAFNARSRRHTTNYRSFKTLVFASCITISAFPILTLLLSPRRDNVILATVKWFDNRVWNGFNNKNPSGLRTRGRHRNVFGTSVK